VSDARTNTRLQEIVRRESRALLQYVGDSFPWSTAGQRGIFAQIQQFIEDESQGIGRIRRLLERRRVTAPFVGSYPSAFTSCNFVSLTYLLPKLVADEKQGIAALEQNLAQVEDPESREVVAKLLESKRQHLQALDRFIISQQPAS
jgi:rubrerythrin